LYDEARGEVVCRACGLVLGNFEFTAPADRITKSNSTSPIAYTSAAVGTKIGSAQQFEVNVAYDIDRVLQKIKFPQPTKHIAITYVRRLLRAVNQQRTTPTDQKPRFTRKQLTALSIWTALKQQKHPISYKEYTQEIKKYVGKVNLMKIEKRATHYIDNVPHIADVKLVTAHINKLVHILENNSIITNHYASILGKYAIEMIHAEQSLMKGHRPDLVAASAIFAADRLIAEYFTLRVFAAFTDVGAGNLSSFAETFKRYAPPVPIESAAIYFTENLFRRIF
jgi:transcription initiation factor TFIIIB Brf1 subunit/transcription initiation factor TFIIB